VPVLRASALLIDNDGVLVDSTSAVDDSWREWCAHWDLDPDEVLPTIHGRPSGETVARLLPAEHVAEGSRLIRAIELRSAGTTTAIPGAGALLASLTPGAWAVVTSGDRELATARLAAAGLAPPPVMITSDDVAQGKPHPDPYLLAARRLDVSPADCLVLEDSAHGVRAARDAGVAHVVAVGTPQDAADAFVPDLRSVRVEGDQVQVG
jgi:sugar-phosphatase